MKRSLIIIAIVVQLVIATISVDIARSLAELSAFLLVVTLVIDKRNESASRRFC
jgi:hypothetical protein